MTPQELLAAEAFVSGQHPRPVTDIVACAMVIAVREGLTINMTGATWGDVLTMVRAELYKL